MKLHDVMKRFMALLLTFALMVGMVGIEALAATFSGRDDISESESNVDEVLDHIHNQGGWKCTQEEGSKVLTCELEEHTHTAECYGDADMELACGMEETEGHVHTEACNPTETRELICGQEETEGHTHTDECYTTETVLTCEIPENHHHTIDCYKLSDNDMGLGTEMQIDGEWYLVEKLICEIPEGHVHGDDCYTTETTLVCGLEETEGHTHTDECYNVTTTYGCGLEEVEPHTHTEVCYADGKGELICGKEEHTHTDECYTVTEGAWTCIPPAENDEAVQSVIDQFSALLERGDLGPSEAYYVATNAYLS